MLQLIVMQQALLRYYGNAIWCIDHVTKENPYMSQYYKGVLERLRNDVRRKRLQKLANGFVLRHDKAPCHTSLLIRQFLSDTKITVCPHP
jgi:hypothetical protein